MIEQVHNFHSYRFQKTVYTIVMLTSLPKDTERLFALLNVRFDARDESEQPHSLFPHRLIFLNPNLLNEHISPNLRLWLQAVQDSLDAKIDLDDYKQQPALQKALLSVQKQTITPEELAKLKDESAWENAKRESHLDGLQQGLQRGLQQGREEIARSLLSQQMPHEQIASATGLSLEHIALLADTLPHAPTHHNT